jgi:WD40 repeat protein
MNTNKEKSPDFSKKYTRKLEKRVNDAIFNYSKQPIIAAAYSYHPAYYVDEYGSYKGFIEPSNVLTFSQGTHFSKVKIYKKFNYLETENQFEELHSQKCMLEKGNILCVAPSPVSNKLRKINLPGEKGKPSKELFTYINTGLAFDSSKKGAHLNKTALGTDNNSIIIVCNEFCWPKAKNANGKEYEICQPKVLGESAMRGGYGSESEEEENSEEEDESEEEENSEDEDESEEEENSEDEDESEEEENSEEEEEAERRRKRIHEEHAKLEQEELDRNNEKIKRTNEKKNASEEPPRLNAEATEKTKKEQEEDEKKAEEAWDAEEEKFKPPKKVKSVKLEKRIGLDAHTGPVNALAWNSKGTKLVSGSADTTIRMWSYVETNNVQLPEFKDFAKTDAAREWAKIKIKNYRPKSHEQGITGRNWNEINEQNINFQLFNNGRESLNLIVEKGVASSQEDKVAKKAYDIWLAPLLQKYNDELKTAWELEEWKCDWISKQETSHGFPRYHVAPILSVSWSPDDKYIVSGSEDGSIILWKPEEGEFKQRLQRDKDLEAHTGPVRSLVWSFNGKTLYSGSEDGTVKAWKHEGHGFTPFRIENAQCNVAFSLKSAHEMGRLNEKRCKLQHSLGESNGTKHAKFLCVNVNEKYIVAGTEDGFIYVWDINTYKLLIVLKKHSKSITGLFWKDPRDPEKIINPPINPDTKRIFDKPEPLLIKDPELLISVSFDKRIKIINIGNNVIRTKQNHEFNIKNKTIKKIREEVVPRLLGHPDMGTVRGGPQYQDIVKRMEDEELEAIQPIMNEIQKKTTQIDKITEQLDKTAEIKLSRPKKIELSKKRITLKKDIKSLWREVTSVAREDRVRNARLRSKLDGGSTRRNKK